MPKSSKLTPEIQKEIGNYILAGSPLKFAAEASGITERTFYNWLEQGETAKSGMYKEFYDYIKECKAKSVQLHLKLITKSANDGNWQASAWILERRFFEHFGRRDKIDMKAEVDAKITGKLELHTLSDEQLLEIINNE